MRVLLAFDKFRGSLTAGEACAAAALALEAAHPDWSLDTCPLTDGGEGFAGILVRAAGGEISHVQVAGPRGGAVSAPVGLVPGSRIPRGALALLCLPMDPETSGPVGVVEMASASGIALLPPALRDPWLASSRGTGQLLKAAADMGAASLLLGVGGSATHDLGLGALAALGLGFTARDGLTRLDPVPSNWAGIARIEGSLPPSMPALRVACDVANPLLGTRGAAAAFGAQKGLRPADLQRLESVTERMAGLLSGHFGAPDDLANVPGAGAAGGMAFGLTVAAGARMLPGFGLVAAWLNLEARLAAADLVLTGEGTFDAGSMGGKGPGAVAALASAKGVQVHVFAGRIDEGAGSCNLPPASLHTITPAGAPQEQAMREAAANLGAAIGRVFS
jgi:glycerate kinase